MLGYLIQVVVYSFMGVINYLLVHLILRCCGFRTFEDFGDTIARTAPTFRANAKAKVRQALLILRCCGFRTFESLGDTIATKAPSFRATGNANVQQATSFQDQPEYSDDKRRRNQYVFPRGGSVKPWFSWADHDPSLVNDAIENGWSQFAFTGKTSSTRRSTLLGLCAVDDQGIETEAEIMWEVCEGSVEFMQKIRFNCRVKRVSIIRTVLPLPGPPLRNNSAFPEEAYFEITILHSHRDYNESVGKVMEEGEIKTKLIQGEFKCKSHFGIFSSQRVNNIEELKVDTYEENGTGEAVKLSLGLTAGGSLPSKLPGSYPGSIGFNSDGSLYLDVKLVFESEEADWGGADRVIGCGFDPRQKKVFFTVDSELEHVVHFKSDEFGTPLYPVLAVNDDILVLVNMGQSVFECGEADAQRTPNPFFIHPPLNSPAAAAVGYEDRRDIFSMTLDSQWLNACAIKGSQNGTNKQAKGSDQEPEVELFEIVLEDSRRPSNSML